MESAKRDEEKTMERARKTLHVLSGVERQARVQEEKIIDVTEIHEGVIEEPAIAKDKRQTHSEVEPL